MQHNRESQELFASRIFEIGFPNNNSEDWIRILKIHHKRVFFHKIFDDRHIKGGKVKITKHNEKAFLTARTLKINNVSNFNLQ